MNDAKNLSKTTMFSFRNVRIKRKIATTKKITFFEQTMLFCKYNKKIYFF